MNITCIKSPKDDLLKSIKFKLRVSFRFLLHLKKKDVNAFGKIKVTFRHDVAYSQFVCFVLGATTITNNLLKLFIVLHKKLQKPTCVLRL